MEYFLGLLALAGLVWGLGGNLTSLGETVHEKASSDQIVAAFQKDCDNWDHIVKTMQDRGDSGYRIRLAQDQRDQAYKAAKRVKSGEKELLDEFGKEKIKTTLSDYAKGKFMDKTWDESQWLMSGYDNANTLNDAYQDKPSEHQARAQKTMEDVGQQADIQAYKKADMLNKAIAEIEVNHILEQVNADRATKGKPPLDIENQEENGLFIAAVKRYFDNVYKSTERTPAAIMQLIAQILQEKYNVPVSVDAGPASIDTVKFRHCDVRIYYRRLAEINDKQGVSLGCEATGNCPQGQFTGKGEWDSSWAGTDYHGTGTINANVDASKVVSLTAHWIRKYVDGEFDDYTLTVHNIPLWKSDPDLGIGWYWLGVSDIPEIHTIDDPRLKNVLVNLTIKNTPAPGSKRKPTTTTDYALVQIRITFGRH